MDSLYVLKKSVNKHRRHEWFYFHQSNYGAFNAEICSEIAIKIDK